MNAVEAAVAMVKGKDEGMPLAGLVFAFILIRGGVATQALLEADVDDWKRQHGDPTWGTVDAWAAQQEIPAALGMAMLVSNEKQYGRPIMPGLQR